MSNPTTETAMARAAMAAGSLDLSSLSAEQAFEMGRQTGIAIRAAENRGRREALTAAADALEADAATLLGFAADPENLLGLVVELLRKRAAARAERPVHVGDLVRLPARIRNSPGGTVSDAVRKQAIELEEEITRDPGRVVSIDDGWAMVDRGHWGQFGAPVEDLVLVDEPRGSGADATA